ncbi:MAG: hypothetical protein QW470_07540 [Candidatus Caldarchaeum sp.]
MAEQAKVKLGFNIFAFHWFFPEIVAVEEGFFADNGLKCELVALKEHGTTDKSDLYVKAMREGRTDFYHCGEWVGVVRVLKGTAGRIAAQSKPAPNTLNSSFTIFVKSGSEVSSPSGLKGKPIAVEAGTGSFYAARADLEIYLRPEEINLVSVPEPHERFKALARGEVSAASLLGPWAKLARKLGFKPVLTTRRDNPTLLVVADRLSDDVVAKLVRSLNKAIEKINSNPLRYNKLYLKYVYEVAEEGDLEKTWLNDLESELLVDRWSLWEQYPYARFVKVSHWMLERGLISESPSESSIRDSFWSFY